MLCIVSSFAFEDFRKVIVIDVNVLRCENR